MCNTPGLSRVCRESYNDPQEVYDRLKRLGMSIVTMTDHDSIDAAEVLRRYPDFFLSEEVTAKHAQRHRDAPGRLRHHASATTSKSSAAATISSPF